MKTIITLVLLLCASTSFAAGGAFQIYNNKLSFPDGSEFSSAPKDGKTIYNGSGVPSLAATEGDFYLDTLNKKLYGPYNGSSWGVGISLVGPQGSKGDTGATGPQGGAGPSLYVVDGGGAIVGNFLGTNESILRLLFNGKIHCINSQFSSWANCETSWKQYVFLSNDCSGSVYVPSDLANNQGIYGFGDDNGNYTSGSQLYSLSNKGPLIATYNSTRYDHGSNGCMQYTWTTTAFELKPDGVVPAHPVGPVTIQVR